MPDYWLREEGVDRWLLEDGSGLWELEESGIVDVPNTAGLHRLTRGLVAITASSLGGVLVE